MAENHTMISHRIVGGMFGMELAQNHSIGTSREPPLFLRDSPQLLCTARSVFTLLSQMLKPAQVWLPSYLCGVVIPSFSQPGTGVRFYAVNERLRIADGQWLARIGAGDMVVFIDYFGFNLWESWGAEARRRGAWVVEDACQALLNTSFSKQAHYVVFSPRKFAGIPDGGILREHDVNHLPQLDLPPPPFPWWQDALTASIRRAEFDRGIRTEDRSWFALFQKVEPAGPSEPCALSELSRFLLWHAIDWPEIASARRRNFQRLAERLGDFALFDELPDSVVPLGFPIRLANRDAVRRALFKENIYPAIHWPIEGVVPPRFKRSHRLSREILTLICDHRCSTDDLDRTAAVMHQAKAKPAQSGRVTEAL